jgi:YVTN family beta-propeller protein
LPSLAVSPDSSTLYVANEEAGTVIVIDATNNYAIKATTTVGSEPEYLVVSPDGKKLYVSNYTEQGTVSVVDTTQTSYPVVATLNTGAYPAALAITPDGTELWVANYGSTYNQIPGTISVFETATDNLKSTIATNGSPWLIAFAKKGKQADVLNYVGGGLIQFINTASEKLSPSVGAAGQLIYPDGMTIDASGSTICIADAVNYVSVCDAIHGVQTAQLSAVSSVYASYELGQPAVTKNGKYLYVPYYYDSGTGAEANQVVMLDVSTGKIVGAPITVDYYPYWTQVSPDGQTLYVVSQQYGAGSVTVNTITPQ